MSALVDMTEKQWTTRIVELSKMLGWLRYHTHRSERSPAGFPDEVLVRDRVVFLELKREKGKPSPLQVEWLDKLATAGAEVYLARPSDEQEIAQVLGKRWHYARHFLSLTPASRRWTPGSLWIPGEGRADGCTYALTRAALPPPASDSGLKPCAPYARVVQT